MSKGRSDEAEQQSMVGRRILPEPFRWRLVLLGGVVGAFVGVAGATITDSERG